jgi:hypothetical protein
MKEKHGERFRVFQNLLDIVHLFTVPFFFSDVSERFFWCLMGALTLSLLHGVLSFRGGGLRSAQVSKETWYAVSKGTSYTVSKETS